MAKSGFTILCLIFLTYCSEKKQSNYIVFEDKDLPKTTLTSSKIDFIEIMDPRMIELQEGLLFVGESYRTTEEVPAIHLIDTENWTYFRSKGAKGQGPNELRAASNSSESQSLQIQRYLHYPGSYIRLVWWDRGV